MVMDSEDEEAYDWLSYRRWLWGLINVALPGQPLWQYEDLEF
jgi:hypothetical protein